MRSRSSTCSTRSSCSRKTAPRGQAALPPVDEGRQRQRAGERPASGGRKPQEHERDRRAGDRHEVTGFVRQPQEDGRRRHHGDRERALEAPPLDVFWAAPAPCAPEDGHRHRQRADEAEAVDARQAEQLGETGVVAPDRLQLGERVVGEHRQVGEGARHASHTGGDPRRPPPAAAAHEEVDAGQQHQDARDPRASGETDRQSGDDRTLPLGGADRAERRRRAPTGSPSRSCSRRRRSACTPAPPPPAWRGVAAVARRSTPPSRWRPRTRSPRGR